MATPEYEKLRVQYKPDAIKWLLVTESPPPGPEQTSTRHFYRVEAGRGDRLFGNTMKAFYPETLDLSEEGLAKQKSELLARFKRDGGYQVESLDESLPHGTTTSIRHKILKEKLPGIISRLKALSNPDTKIILIKSTVYKMAFDDLKAAGLNVINDTFVDYPGYWREKQYVDKLSRLIRDHGWQDNKQA